MQTTQAEMGIILRLPEPHHLRLEDSEIPLLRIHLTEQHNTYQHHQ